MNFPPADFPELFRVYTHVLGVLRDNRVRMRPFDTGEMRGWRGLHRGRTYKLTHRMQWELSDPAPTRFGRVRLRATQTRDVRRNPQSINARSIDVLVGHTISAEDAIIGLGPIIEKLLWCDWRKYSSQIFTIT